MNSVSFLAMPANVSTQGTNPRQSSLQNENRLKTFVGYFHRNKTSNQYENHAISREQTEYHSQQGQCRQFQPQVVPVAHAEEKFSDAEEESVG